MGFCYIYSLLLFLCVHVLATAPGRNLTICRPWKCINNKLNLTTESSDGSLAFERSKLSSYLTSKLEEAGWQKPVERALNACLAPIKPRTYSMTCPGQETWHCIVDQLSENCVESNINKTDACTPVVSILGVKYLFSQNTYLNMERNIQKDYSPPWFLRNYLNAKCCNLPSLFQDSVLKECGMSAFMNVRKHQPVHRNEPWLSRPETTSEPPSEYDCNTPLEDVNPLECCDTTGLISPSTFAECEFNLQWDKVKRLTFKNKEIEFTPTTRPVDKVQKKTRSSDVKMLPLSCQEESCVFNKLKIILADGSIDKDAYSRLLDNFTKEHPTWVSAKARVVTKCLKRKLYDYEAECEINKVLACTFDVLSENCPTALKISADPCRHSSTSQNTTTLCQVSASKYRKSRRHFCDFPRLVHQSVLAECGLQSLSHMEVVKEDLYDKMKRKPGSIFKYTPSCITTDNATSCVMSRLGVISKFGFLDALKLKQKAHNLITKIFPWYYLNRSQIDYDLTYAPHYQQYCPSTKKLLNFLDTIIKVCPASQRKNTESCNRLYKHIDRCTHVDADSSSRSPIIFQQNPLAIAPPTTKPIRVRFFNSNKTLFVSMLRPPPSPLNPALYTPVLHSKIPYPNQHLVKPISLPVNTLPYSPILHSQMLNQPMPNSQMGQILYSPNYFRSLDIHGKLTPTTSKFTNSKMVLAEQGLQRGVGILEPMIIDGQMFE